MEVEVVAGSSNVVPFVRPARLERHDERREERVRPSRDVLFDLRCQVREIDELLEEPYHERSWWGLRDEVDAETAVFIAEQLTHGGRVSSAALDGLLDPAIERAIEACREALSSWAELGKARERARVSGNSGIAWFAQQVDALTEQTMGLVEAALTLDQQVSGIERAVGFARRGEVWVRRDPHEGIQWLLDAEEAAQLAKAEALTRSAR
jgi:hypothetical protein